MAPSRGLALVALLSAVAALARPARAGESAVTPPPTPVVVATELVPYPKPGDPPPKDLEPRATQMAIVAELEAGAPAGAALPAAAGEPWHGTLEAGPRKILVPA